MSECPLSLWRYEMRPIGHSTMAEIIAMVAEKHGVSVGEIKGRSKIRKIAHARLEAMYVLREAKHWSSGQIGRALGGRDHSTVIQGHRSHLRRMGQ